MLTYAAIFWITLDYFPKSWITHTKSMKISETYVAYKVPGYGLCRRCKRL